MKKNVGVFDNLALGPLFILLYSDLVWSGIAENLSGLVSIWWEHPELVNKLNAFRRVRQNDVQFWILGVDQRAGTLRSIGGTSGL